MTKDFKGQLLKSFFVALLKFFLGTRYLPVIFFWTKEIKTEINRNKFRFLARTKTRSCLAVWRPNRTGTDIVASTPNRNALVPRGIR